jgi:hypothetical protein
MNMAFGNNARITILVRVSEVICKNWCVQDTKEALQTCERYTAYYKKGFTTFKAYINLFIAHS